MKKSGNWIKRLGMTVVCLSTMGASIESLAQSHDGTDIGHGSPGQLLVGSIPHYQPIDAVLWCGEVSGYIDDALAMANISMSPGQSRRYLRESIKSILDAYQGSYQGGGLPFQPLTYSLLKTILKIDRNFPSSPSDPLVVQADQAAAISMFTLLKAAKRVNEQFDVPRFTQYMERLRCHHDCAGSIDPEPQFYIAYVDSARLVLDSLYEPVYAQRPYLGTTLDAMANETWELKSLLDLVSWVRQSIQNDIFGRQLVCVKGAVYKIEERLCNYLGGLKEPFNDTTMRMFAESRLDDVRHTLNGIAFDEGQFFCRPHHRH